MMDAVFGFRATKMKPQLKMAVQRFNLIKNKKINKINGTSMENLGKFREQLIKI